MNRQLSRCFTLAALLFGVSVTASTQPHSAIVPSPNTAATHRQAEQAYRRQSAIFIENKGQWDPQAKFLLRSPGLDLWITDHGVVYDLIRVDAAAVKTTTSPMSAEAVGDRPVVRRTAVFVSFLGAAADAAARGSERAAGYHNYFIGNDPSKWATNVPLYSGARIEKLYNGIDAVFYLDAGRPRYDLVLAPGADAQQVRMKFQGAEKVSIDRSGTLVMTTSLGELRQQELYAYQLRDGKQEQVRCGFRQGTDGVVRFDIGSYDRTRPLVIDPVVIAYSTYLGGTDYDWGYGIAVDGSGTAYITGITNSTDFPTMNAPDATLGGISDAFVTILTRSGALASSTYLGGSSYEWGFGGIAVDSGGNVYLTGWTASSDFPTTLVGGPGAFVTKLTSAGAISYSTFLGGSDIAVDPAGNAYVTGHTTGGVAVTKLTSAGTISYSTFLPGSVDEEGPWIAVDPGGNAYITGSTQSADFPTMNPAQGTNAGGSDAFVTKLTSAGAISYSTFLGGSSTEFAADIAVDPDGNAYVTGRTFSEDFPTMNAQDATYGGLKDAYITKLTSGGAISYSTFLGGSYVDEGTGIAVDGSGNAYITGITYSPDFPTVNPQDSTLGGFDAYVTKLTSTGSLSYSTFLGGSSGDLGRGIAVDRSGNAYITGWTFSTDFPTVHAHDATLGGIGDVFVTKLASVAQIRIQQSTAAVVDNSNDNLVDVSLDYTNPTPLRGLQLSIEINTPNIQVSEVSLGSAIADPDDWTFQYQITNAATGSAIEIILFGRTDADVIAAASDAPIVQLRYSVPDIRLCDGAAGGDVTSGEILLTAVSSTLNDGLGSDAGVMIDATGDRQTVTIYNTSSRGDVDCNDRVDVLDLTRTINVAIRRNTFALWQKNRADLAPWSALWATPGIIFSDANNYGDNAINVQDAVLMADAILYGHWPDSKPLYRIGQSKDSGADPLSRLSSIYDVRLTCYVNASGVQVWMENKVPVAAMQFDLRVPDAPEQIEALLNAVYGDNFLARAKRVGENVRVLLYSLTGDVIAPQNGSLLDLPMPGIDGSKVEIVGAVTAGDGEGNPLLVESEIIDGVAGIAETETAGDISIAVSPNPAGDHLQIDYTVVRATPVRMRITTTTGVEVYLFTESRVDAGRHTFTCDASALASGSYICTMVAGSQQLSRRFVIVR